MSALATSLKCRYGFPVQQTTDNKVVWEFALIPKGGKITKLNQISSVVRRVLDCQEIPQNGGLFFETTSAIEFKVGDRVEILLQDQKSEKARIREIIFDGSGLDKASSSLNPLYVKVDWCDKKARTYTQGYEHISVLAINRKV